MKKTFISIVIAVILIIIAFVYINLNYLYNPLTYPNDNIEKYDYSFLTFKKPIVMQVVKWDEEGQQSFYHYVTDEKKIKNLLEQFDRANKMKDFTIDQYLANLPFGERGSEYNIIFRQVERWDHNNVAHGRILINFTFYKNNDVIEISGVHFYELKASFKEDILNALSNKDKWITK
ncbi:hypothetical protein [Pontibacillus marinus]|uniref:Uncharacterized protein n=1 Tax=Pontibacillus marinus BH030004 = DSM 16465 TaxID=1385511 RepID=A0A0A5GAF8_9BACI|nr:hypothetical protein [Pontibacillus marinus]KGX90161.1 hypothetical protein N783_01330 [Pontibacillus marinus BH030004 = DSM 16465]